MDNRAARQCTLAVRGLAAAFVLDFGLRLVTLDALAMLVDVALVVSFGHAARALAACTSCEALEAEAREYAAIEALTRAFSVRVMIVVSLCGLGLGWLAWSTTVV